MGFPSKTLNTKALLAKLEATYATAIAVTATADGHLMHLTDRTSSIFTPAWTYDGAVGPSPGNLGMLKRVAAVGRTASGNIPMRAKPGGATYAATVLPNLHTMLKICGMDSALSSGTYTYTPTADSITYSSATMEAYARQQKWSLRGVLGSFEFEAKDLGIPVWQFNCSGIMDTAVADSAIVAPTYPNLTAVEPLAVGTSLTIGNWITPVVKSYGFKMNRTISPRLDQTAADGHGGFVPAGYDPEFTITVEQTALTYPTASGGFDPYSMVLNAEANAINLTVGSSTLNRWKFQMPQVQLKSFTENNDGPVATVTLVFAPYNSTIITQTDAFKVVWD